MADVIRYVFVIWHVYIYIYIYIFFMAYIIWHILDGIYYLACAGGLEPWASFNESCSAEWNSGLFLGLLGYPDLPKRLH